MFKHSILAAVGLAALLSHAQAADWLNARDAVANAPLPVKAAPLPIPVATCSVTGCNGFELGGNFTGSGTGISIANLGSLNAGGSYMGLEANYMFYNGTYLLGGGGKLEYEVADPATGGIGGALSNKLFGFAYVEAGGALGNIFNIPSVTLPGWLAASVPSARIGACWHGSVSGVCSAFHARLFIPNSKWTVNADYTNAQYNNHATSVPGVTANSENRGSLGVSYHF